LSPAPQAAPQAAGLSEAPQAAGLSDAPQAAGLSDAPQAEAGAESSWFHADRLESAIMMTSKMYFSELLALCNAYCSRKYPGYKYAPFCNLWNAHRRRMQKFSRRKLPQASFFKNPITKIAGISQKREIPAVFQIGNALTSKF
jgi:hypothetical protein